MIVRDLNVEKNTTRKVESKGWDSVRLLLKDDGVGFSFHITTIHAGTEHLFHYKNHFECVYCISGNGSIENSATGELHPIHPGVMYVLNEHDRHRLKGDTEMVMACVFNPPVTGREVHLEDGSYALEGAPI